MLHLRMIVPPERTEAVLEIVGRTVGTTHLVVLEGAGRVPPGDLVMCDVAREAGDELIQELQAPGLDEDGSMPLLLNLGGIMLAGTVTMYAQKALWRTRRGRWIRRAGGGAPGH